MDDTFDEDISNEQWQESLALSSYLKLRKEGRMSSSVMSGMSTTSSFGHFSPVNRPTAASRVTTNASQLYDSSTIPPAALSDDELFGGQSNHPSIQLDFTPEESRNLDITGMKLLLTAALRDKEVLRNKVDSIASELSKAMEEKQVVLDQSTKVYALTSSANQWKLPLKLISLLGNKLLEVKYKVFLKWNQVINKESIVVNQDKNRLLILKLARRNILKLRLLKQKEHFRLWRLNIEKMDIKLHIITRSVSKQRDWNIQKRIFAFMQRKKRISRFIRKVMLNKERNALRKAWQFILRFGAHNQQIKETLTSRHSVYEAKIARLLLIYRKKDAQRVLKVNAWRLWVAFTEKQRNLVIKCKFVEHVVMKYFNPKSDCFRQWKKIALEDEPKRQHAVKVLKVPQWSPSPIAS